MRNVSLLALGASLLFTACAPTTERGVCGDNPTACGSACIRPVSCVAECGGPVTECGCCGCAEGSIDTIDCS